MSDFTPSTELLAAQLAATVAFADTGTTNSYITIYDAAENLLVTVQLAKPCGTVTTGVLQLHQEAPGGDLIAASGVLQLHQEAPGGDLIAASGVATRASWFAGNGSLVAQGDVTDEAGAGPFILGGAAGTQLYAGGRAILGVTEIT